MTLCYFSVLKFFPGFGNDHCVSYQHLVVTDEPHIEITQNISKITKVVMDEIKIRI